MQVIGAPIAAGLMMMDGLRGIRGWKWLFLIEGAITVLFGILFFVSALLSGRPLPCAYCMMCGGQWGSPQAAPCNGHVACYVMESGCFQSKGTISMLLGILLFVSAFLIRWCLPSYQP